MAQRYEFAGQRLAKVSVVGAYRDLEVLTPSGITRELETSGTEARFDGDLHHHYHVRCARCGRVDRIRGVFGDRLRFNFWNLSGYDIIGHPLRHVPGVQGDYRRECQRRVAAGPIAGAGLRRSATALWFATCETIETMWFLRSQRSIRSQRERGAWTKGGTKND